MIGFVVRYTIEKVLRNDDGSYREDDYTPEMFNEYFHMSFDSAFKKCIEYYKHHENGNWYPGYICDAERNKIRFRIVRGENYGKFYYRTTLQIEECFYEEEWA